VPTFIKVPPLSRDIAPYELHVNGKRTDGWMAYPKNTLLPPWLLRSRQKIPITVVGIVIVVITLTIRLKHF